MQGKDPRLPSAEINNISLDGPALSAILNRIKKNAARLKPWAQRHRIDAYRLYDRDIPEFPAIIDRYADRFVVYDRGDASSERDRAHVTLAARALEDGFGVSPDRIFLKTRARQSRENQYEKLGDRGEEFSVREGEALFRVNLSDYLDTGLFLDHRLIRERVRKRARDRDVLNLFSYTGSVSVCAALGGARAVTSVDLSTTYTNWAQENFRLNSLSLENHEFVRANALEWLRNAASTARARRYDLVFLDPPTFSKSKRMGEETFEVERDQVELVRLCMERVAPGGELWFSCNKRTFRLAAEIESRYQVKDVTLDTIPFDFRDQKIHRAFEIRRAPEPGDDAR